MTPTLRASFYGPEMFPHELVKAADNKSCPICRDPSVASTNLDAPGCRAIRFTECGHIVGDRCFRKRLQFHPNTCPFLSHDHKLTPNVTKGLDIKAILAYICGSSWFSIFRRALLAAAINNIGRDTDITPFDALDTFHTNELTREQVWVMACRSARVSLALGVLLGITFYKIVSWAYHLVLVIWNWASYLLLRNVCYEKLVMGFIVTYAAIAIDLAIYFLIVAALRSRRGRRLST